MIRRLMLTGLLLGGCAGEDGSTVDVETLAAGEMGCPAGGFVLTVDGEETTACNGADGAAGAPGADGADGTDGTDGFVSVATFSCYAEPVLPGGYTASIYYGGHTFANEYVFTQCSTQSTSTGDVSANLYTPQQVGSDTMQCVALGDSNMLLDGGWWEFGTLDDGTRRATYHDPVAVDNGAFYDFTAMDCAD